MGNHTQETVASTPLEKTTIKAVVTLLTDHSKKYAVFNYDTREIVVPFNC